MTKNTSPEPLAQAVSSRNYHPEFHGSTSIENVLPVLVPDMSYERMEIGDGTPPLPCSR